jgi:hypothetical protein
MPSRCACAQRLANRGDRVRDHLHWRQAPARRPASAAVSRIAAAAAFALVAAAAATPAMAAGLAPAAAGSAAAAAAGAAAAGSAAAASPVLLINGDRLLIRRTPSGGRAITLLPAPGAQSIVSLSSGSRSEDIPSDALPYLGRGLDPSLFDLSALRLAEAGGRLPVQVSYVGRRPALPGVTITQARRGIARGYLTSSSAAAFGAALARQFRADQARASYGRDGLFGRGVAIALAGAAGPAPLTAGRPDFPMHTLTVRGSNLNGKPDNGDLVIVINADNPATFGDGNENENFFFHGAAKFSVPAGHYWAIGDFLKFTRTSAAERLSVLPQFTVAGQSTRVHVSEQAASSEITMVTTRPAVSQLTGFTMIRGGQHGTSQSVSFFDSGLSLWVSPTTKKPTVGTLRSLTSAQLTSPTNAAGTPYAYNLDFQGPDGTIPPQHFVVSPGSLATVNERYYQDVPSDGAWSTLGGFPAQLDGLVFAQFVPLRLPGLQTQYMSGGPSLVWLSSYVESNNFFTGGQSDNFRTLLAGQQLTQDWNRYPLHPQPSVNLLAGNAGRQFPTFPSAFRSGNTLTLGFTPFSDNEPGHLGAGFFGGHGLAVTGRYVIHQNGVRIARGNPVDGIAPVLLSAKPSVIRLALTAARSGKSFPQSASSTTVWTWRSAREPNATLPPSYFCGFVVVGNQLRLLRRCAVQPMLTLGYQVQGLALDGSTPPGSQVVSLHVGHLQLATGAPVTGATVQVSFDDGQIWQPAAVTSAGGGNFQASFTAPAGVDVTLRVGAKDAAGGSVTETIVRAYGVGL